MLVSDVSNGSIFKKASTKIVSFNISKWNSELNCFLCSMRMKWFLWWIHIHHIQNYEFHASNLRFYTKNKTYIWYPRIEWSKSNIYCLRSTLRVFTDESQSINSADTSYTRTVTVPSLGCFQQPWFNIKPYMVSLDPCVPLCINKKEIA